MKKTRLLTGFVMRTSYKNIRTYLVELPCINESWQCWHLRTTSDGNELEVVTNGINFTANVHLS